jgi:hypothetical protein
MTLTLVAMLLAAQGAPDAALPRSLSLEEPRKLQDPSQEKFPKSEPPSPAARQEERPFVDFDWLELSAGVGVVAYSSDYLADPSFAVTVRAHAPMPWLSPSGPVVKEYFGLFAEASFMGIDRDMSPTVDHRSGVISYFSLGADYTILRDDTWLLVARAGVVYVYYGGVADLDSGIGPLLGLSAGIQLSGSFSIAYTPEIVFAKSGNWILLNTVGVNIQF